MPPRKPMPPLPPPPPPRGIGGCPMLDEGPPLRPRSKLPPLPVEDSRSLAPPRAGEAELRSGAPILPTALPALPPSLAVLEVAPREGDRSGCGERSALAKFSFSCSFFSRSYFSILSNSICRKSSTCIDGGRDVLGGRDRKGSWRPGPPERAGQPPRPPRIGATNFLPLPPPREMLIVSRPGRFGFLRGT